MKAKKTICPIGVQVSIAVQSILAYLKVPREQRGGHLRFVLFSSAMLAAYSVVLVFDIWIVFDSLFKAGPSGKSYIEAYRKDTQSNSSSRSRWILSKALGDAVVTAADSLMVRRDCAP
jgi:hypothetical protein